MTDGDCAEILAGVVDAVRDVDGRALTVEETPVGVKLGLEMENVRDAWNVLEADGRKFIDEYEGVLVSIYEGELGVVDELSDEEWPHFLELVEEADGIDIGGEELREARGGDV